MQTEWDSLTSQITECFDKTKKRIADVYNKTARRNVIASQSERTGGHDSTVHTPTRELDGVLH